MSGGKVSAICEKKQKTRYTSKFEISSHIRKISERINNWLHLVERMNDDRLTSDVLFAPGATSCKTDEKQA